MPRRAGISGVSARRERGPPPNWLETAGFDVFPRLLFAGPALLNRNGDNFRCFFIKKGSLPAKNLDKARPNFYSEFKINKKVRAINRLFTKELLNEEIGEEICLCGSPAGPGDLRMCI
jgi:hypothetical protein